MILQRLTHQAVNRLPIFITSPPLLLWKKPKSKTVRIDERRNQTRKNRSTVTGETQDAFWLILWHRMNESPNRLFHFEVPQSRWE